MADKMIDKPSPSIKVIDTKKKTNLLQIAGLGQNGNNNEGNEGIYINSDYYRNDIVGKPYPGRVNFNTQRVLAYNSTIVRAVLTLRSHQVAKLPVTIVPANAEEPPKQINILDYNIYQMDNHPAFDDPEKDFLAKLYYKLDPAAFDKDKRKTFEEDEDGVVSDSDRSIVEYLQKKHDEFYRKRQKDKKKILEILKDPDPWFTNVRSWEKLVKSILMDMLVIDRGVIIKLRDSSGNLKGLMPVDGSSIRPVINKFGTFNDDYAYVQVVHGSPHVYLKKEDVIVIIMNPMTDLKYFGYGLSNMETLYTAVLSDIFIDKGNLDFYRKGGSIPEGFISIEPPPSREGMIQQIDQEQLEMIQRHLQSIMMGDFTQVPIVSGGKISWIDFKGKRRDMQFKELAEYLTRKICAVYQVSPQDVGVVSDVNRSTAVVQSEMTKNKGLRTLMGVISEYITSQVINEIRPEGDLKLWFEDDDMERRKNEWTMNQQQLVSGAMVINEWRAKQGMHPVPWGNTPLQGLRNWKPEDDEAGGGMGGMPGGMGDPSGMAGGLPPLPGLGGPGGGAGAPPPPMGGPGQAQVVPQPAPSGNLPGIGSLPDISSLPMIPGSSPGGPIGGANPMSGQEANVPSGAPPIGSMMKSKFFGFNKSDDQRMVEHFSSIYEDGAVFNDFHAKFNYPGSNYIRKSIDSYKHFLNKNPNFGKIVIKSESYDPDDPLIFSRYDNGTIEIDDDNGDIPVFKAIVNSVIDNISEDKADGVKITINTNDQDLIKSAVEWAVFKSFDEPLRDSLYNNFYKFQNQPFSDAILERVGDILEL